MMKKTIIECVMSLTLCILICTGCANQRDTVDPISQVTPTVLIQAIITKTVQTVDGLVTEEVKQQPVVPTASIQKLTETSDSGDHIYLFSRDLGSVYFFLNPFEPKNDHWLGPEFFSNLQDLDDRFKTIRFSFHKNQIAYQKNNGEIWISDLLLGNGTLLDGLSIDDKTQVSLIWTPDDRHLIIDILDAKQKDFIYHMATGQVEPWDRICNQLVMSPKTKHLAVGCLSTGSDLYAYLEWGGEIWLTKNPTDDVIVQLDSIKPIQNQEDPYRNLPDLQTQYSIFPIHLISGWSSDGKQVAYYDPQDDAGSLNIINSDGTLVSTILWKAYWLKHGDQQNVLLSGLPIQWSYNGQKILLYGYGGEQVKCPADTSESDKVSIDDTTDHCWQVLDVESWKIQWYTGLLEQGTASYYENASLSKDGNTLAINTLYFSGSKFQVIDILKSKIILDTPLRVSDFRWERSN